MDRKRHKPNDVCDRRLHINIFSFVFTCIVLITTKVIASDEFTQRINQITYTLNKSLGLALDTQMTNYTSIYENVTYVSTTTFNAKGMAVLYNVTTKFMDLIAPKDVYPEGLIKVEHGSLKLGSFEEQWQSILAHYGAILAIVILLLLFAFLMPLCGFCFCCCRCCGKCGARSKPFDKKGDLCKKICLASLLICVGTLLLFGVVCAFVTNQALQDNTSELSPSLKNSVKDTDSYLSYTGRQVHVLLDINYHEFEERLLTTLNECSDIITNELEEYTNATSLEEVVKIVDSLEQIKGHLLFIQESTHILRTNASQLGDGLRKVKTDLLNILKDCDDVSECASLSNKYINDLKVEIHFESLPSVSKPLDNLSKVLDSELRDSLTKGQKALTDIKNAINETVVTELPNIRSAIKKVGKDIVKYGTNITSVIKKACDSLHIYVDSPIEDIDKYVKEYTPYRYYLGIAVGCVLLLVSLCITLGLICGICGKRPDAYGDDCCNKGAGSRFLMVGVAIMFLFSIILAAVAIVYFFTGVLAQRLACDSLRNYNDNQVVRLIDDVINLKQSIGVDAKISTVLSSIHRNDSIYHTFNLKNYFDLEDVDKYMENLEIKDKLNKLKEKINPDTENIELIHGDVKKHLHSLGNSGIQEIQFDIFKEELQHNFTKVDLSELAGKLDKLAEIINKTNKKKYIVTGLMISSLHLRTYQDNLVQPMINKSQDLIERIKILESFRVTLETIPTLIEKLEQAQLTLQQNGSLFIKQFVDNFAAGVENQVQTYLNRTVTHVREHLGITEPISHMFNATLVATCDKILLPWNGFWFSIFWCLILFIPAIILSVKLAGLYQKYEAYPGPLVEAEYLYDAYAERDNIPLSSSRDDKRHKKKKKQKRSDGRGAYVAEPPNDHGIAREVPSGSARYSDMAPKHWEEFPAGGPPHYQRAPTEYERPPPYYYPNTEQQQ